MRIIAIGGRLYHLREFRPIRAWRLLRQFEAATDEFDIVETSKELTDLGGFGVRRSLERVLRTHPNETTRALAASALGFRGDTRAAKALGEAYVDTSETIEVRSSAAEGLGQLFEFDARARRYTPIVLEGLNAPAPELRFWSCYALAMFGDKSALPELEKLVGDESDVTGWWPVGEEAQWAIAQIHGDHDFEPPGMKAWPRANHCG
jgi:HEAT repeat protein